MKYIRTKDGRVLKVFYESVSMFEENDGCTYYGENTVDFETSLFIPKSEIINEANTIEELCDELIIKYKSEKKPRYIDMTELLKTCKNVGVAFRKHVKWIFANYKDQIEICNGAIWTNKGLIYVAKMNDKGELELL